MQNQLNATFLAPSIFRLIFFFFIQENPFFLQHIHIYKKSFLTQTHLPLLLIILFVFKCQLISLFLSKIFFVLSWLSFFSVLFCFIITNSLIFFYSNDKLLYLHFKFKLLVVDFCKFYFCFKFKLHFKIIKF